MKTPKVRHKKLKTLGQGLYLCTDKRATSEKSFEGSAGGGGYEYLGFENKILEYRKREERRNHYIRRKALSREVQAVQAPIGTQDNG